MKKLLNFKLSFLLIIGIVMFYSSCDQERVSDASETELTFDEMVESFKSTIEKNNRSVSNSETRSEDKCLDVINEDCEVISTTTGETDYIEVYPGCLVSVTYDVTVCYNEENTAGGIFNYIITNFQHGDACDSIQTIYDDFIANHDIAGYKAAKDQFTLDISFALENEIISSAIALSQLQVQYPIIFDCGSTTLLFGSTFELNNCFKYWYILNNNPDDPYAGLLDSGKESCGSACCIRKSVYCLAGSGKNKNLVSSVLAQYQAGECDDDVSLPFLVSWSGDCELHFDCD